MTRIPFSIMSSSMPANPRRSPALFPLLHGKQAVRSRTGLPALRVFSRSASASVPRGRSTHWNNPPRGFFHRTSGGEVRLHGVRHQVAPSAVDGLLALQVLFHQALQTELQEGALEDAVGVQVRELLDQQEPVDDRTAGRRSSSGGFPGRGSPRSCPCRSHPPPCPAPSAGAPPGRRRTARGRSRPPRSRAAAPAPARAGAPAGRGKARRRWGCDRWGSCTGAWHCAGRGRSRQGRRGCRHHRWGCPTQLACRERKTPRAPG